MSTQWTLTLQPGGKIRFTWSGGANPQLGKEQPPEDKPSFKSSFKTWIRVVAFIVVAVFLPEQAAQAAGYDLA
jgi:hypothetical protein